MASIIVAFPKIEDATAIKSLLARKGYNVAAPCTTGAQAVNIADGLSDGIIVCGYRLGDMVYSELYDYKPKSFDMLLVASPNLWDNSIADVAFLPMPIKVFELQNTIENMLQEQFMRRRRMRSKPRQRNEGDMRIIDEAKKILIEKHNMTEPEAHRYIQKCSMDSGNSFVESAAMVISIDSQEEKK